MKSLLCKLAASGVALALVSSTVFAAAGWSDDYEKGLAQAKAEKKLLLLNFTGPEWCPWCIRLDKEVLSKKEFKEYAEKNTKLVELDFSPDGKPESKQFSQQHEKLMAKYKVEGFPTIIVLNSEGKQVGQLGYMEGGPKAFLAELDKLKSK